MLRACLVVGGLSCSRGLVWYSLQFFINTMCGRLCSVLGVCLAVCGLACSRKLVLYNLQFRL